MTGVVPLAISFPQPETYAPVPRQGGRAKGLLQITGESRYQAAGLDTAW